MQQPIFSHASAGLLTSNDDLSAIVSSFPSGTICHAVGYGSGVFVQKMSSHDDDDTRRNRKPDHSLESSSKSALISADTSCSPMIDIILVVQDAQRFHEKNIVQNTLHYSSFANTVLGSSGAANVQNIGPGVYFNPYSNIAGFEVKYGVITKEKLLTDLLDWEYLYIAGRMQKPTVCIGQGDDEVLDAHRLNIKSALSASLLLLTMNQDLNEIRQKQVTIPISQIFSAIAQISYTGDFRMTLGAEDKNKVSKLIHSPGQHNRWVEMYTPPLLNLRSQGVLDVTKRSDGEVIMVECDLQDLSVRRELIKHLPKGLQQKLEPSVDKCSGMSGAILSSELVKIVSNASRVQGVKGLLTAGVSKSIKYAVAKFSKGMLKK